MVVGWEDQLPRKGEAAPRNRGGKRFRSETDFTGPCPFPEN